mgnify:CR=1 FL=1
MPKETPTQKSWERERWLLPIGKDNIDSIIDASKAFISGSGAGVLSKTSVAPMERTKVLAQIEQLRGTNRSIVTIIKEYVYVYLCFNL